VVVENVSGAGGMTGVARVAKAAPDGYQVARIVAQIRRQWPRVRATLPYSTSVGGNSMVLDFISPAMPNRSSKLAT
jgi:hypothetical protein